MSSFYSSLDWVLSHWTHFTVHRFISVYLSVFYVFLLTACVLYYCNAVKWTWCDWSLILRNLASFSALTLLVESFDLEKPVNDTTYNVFGGTLNLTQSNQSPVNNHSHLITVRHFLCHHPCYSSFSIASSKLITYNVFGGTLNLSQLWLLWFCANCNRKQLATWPN